MSEVLDMENIPFLQSICRATDCREGDIVQTLAEYVFLLAVMFI